MKIETLERAQELSQELKELEATLRQYEADKKAIDSCGPMLGRSISLTYLDRYSASQIWRMACESVKGRLAAAQKEFDSL